MNLVLFSMLGISTAAVACNKQKPEINEKQTGTQSQLTEAQKYPQEYVNNYEHIFVMDASFRNSKGENSRLWF